MSPEWEALVVELYQTTPASMGRCRVWADLGLQRGWTLEQTKRIAFDCVVVGVSPRMLAAALVPLLPPNGGRP